MIITRFVLIMLLLGAFGCSGATYIRATVKNNPLDQVAQIAQLEDWSINGADANTLQLSNAWLYHSIVSLGYAASRANLVYDPTDAVLHIQYYLRVYSPYFLFIPFYQNAEPRRYYSHKGGWNPAPFMNEEINAILQWSGASEVSRRHGKLSEIFPPTRPISSPP